MNLKEAEAIAGTLGEPSKMPGYSYGLSAFKCNVGSELRKIPGSTCSKCYALKGHYAFQHVKLSHERRMNGLRHPRWVEAMVFMIRFRGEKWFRWHDSGDLQGDWHLEKIVEVARQLPDVKFWLPTREMALVRGKVFPENLVVRVSAALIDAPPPKGFRNTSTVVSFEGETCPAPKQGNECRKCRKCWDPDVQNVSYRRH